MNKVIKFPDHSAIEQEAAAWVAKLDGGALSRADLKALRRWAQQSAKHRSMLEEMAERWDLLDALSLAQPAERPSAGSRRWWGAAALAAGLTALTLAISLWQPRFGSVPEVVDASSNTTYYTAVGQQRTVVLPDRSVIRINTNSRLQVDYSSQQRRIFLQQGEAFFDVAKGEIPFVVSAGKGQAEALGTAFAVRLSDENVVDVDITEGRVRVSVSSDERLPGSSGKVSSRVFTGGEVARINDSVELVEKLEPEVLERQLSWREGLLMFDGDSLESVIAEISRYTSMEIVIADPSLRGKKIIGYFPTTNTEVLLDTLASDFRIEVDRIRPGLVYLHPLAH